MKQYGGRGLQMITALLLSLALWTFVSYSTNPSKDQSITIPILPTNLPSMLVLVDPQTKQPLSRFPAEVSFVATGPQDVIDQLQAANFKASIDLSAMTPGDHSVQVEIDQPSGVRVHTITPAQITVQLDTIITRTVPIEVKRQGQVPFLFTVGSITRSLEQVEVGGPATLVDTVASAHAFVPLQNQTSDLQTEIPVLPVDQNGQVVEGVVLSPSEVAVMVAITPRVQGQRISVVPDYLGSPAPGYVLSGLDWEPKIVNVLTPNIVTGTLITEPINLNNATSTITRTVRLAADANVITDPGDVLITVTLFIQPIQVQSQLPLFVPIAPVNIGDGLLATAAPLAIQITLAGAFEDLNKLTPADVAATVDLSNLGPGNYRLPVEIMITPPNVQRIAPANPEINITLTSTASSSSATPNASSTPSDGR